MFQGHRQARKAGFGSQKLAQLEKQLNVKFKFQFCHLLCDSAFLCVSCFHLSSKGNHRIYLTGWLCGLNEIVHISPCRSVFIFAHGDWQVASAQCKAAMHREDSFLLAVFSEMMTGSPSHSVS